MIGSPRRLNYVQYDTSCQNWSKLTSNGLLRQIVFQFWEKSLIRYSKLVYQYIRKMRGAELWTKKLKGGHLTTHRLLESKGITRLLKSVSAYFFSLSSLLFVQCLRPTWAHHLCGAISAEEVWPQLSRQRLGLGRPRRRDLTLGPGYRRRQGGGAANHCHSWVAVPPPSPQVLARHGLRSPQVLTRHAVCHSLGKGVRRSADERRGQVLMGRTADKRKTSLLLYTCTAHGTNIRVPR